MQCIHNKSPPKCGRAIASCLYHYIRSVSHVLYQCTANDTYVLYNGGNHLSTDCMNPSFSLFISKKESAPTIIWVSRSWGLPVPPFPFPGRLRHCGTFIGIHTISQTRLRCFPGRQPTISAASAYEFAEHEHYGHRSPCEHGLSSASPKGACSDYPNVRNEDNVYYIHF